MDIKEEIFRAYDIRGIYKKDLDEEIAEIIGKAFGTFIGENKKVAIGRDVRISSENLEKSFIKGLLKTGCQIIPIGLIHTPLLYFVIIHYSLDGGVMISASHNPPEWNGFKLCKEKAILCGQGMGMEEIKSIAFSKNFKISNKGKIIEKKNIIEEYKKFILSKVEIEKGLRIGIDPGNGSCSIIAKKILEEKGLEVFSINDFPDGRFPAHLPEPNEENLKELKELVIEKNLDFGVGFDGDGDRAVFIDDKGRIIRGDIALAILVNHYLTKEKPEKIVYEVSCSKALEETIRKKGGIPIVSRVGHAFILDKMINENALFGGEISSHLYFREIYGLDDSIFACLKMAELLSQSNSNLSKLIEKIPKYYSISPKNFDCPDNLKFKIVEELKNEMIKEGYKTIAIDGVRVELNEGWFLVRASNTQPQIRMIAEAKSEEALNKIINFAKEKLFEKLKEENIIR
jgi:phosphoglucosamine mutase